MYSLSEKCKLEIKDTLRYDLCIKVKEKLLPSIRNFKKFLSKVSFTV